MLHKYKNILCTAVWTRRPPPLWCVRVLFGWEDLLGWMITEAMEGVLPWYLHLL